jgi:hydrogenase expression/formation protein HypE
MTRIQQHKPVISPHSKRIVLAHGGGGQLTDELIDEVIRPRLHNEWLDALDDSAVLNVDAGRIAFTTDSYVVQPLEFPGGDIGRLAVSGTVNDLAVCGATNGSISLSLILEEGLEMELLKRVLDSVAATAAEAGVRIVTGDTKVVARGQADGMYINTAGVGAVPRNVQLGMDRIKPTDAVLISGDIADHGLAVMLQREQQSVIRSTLASDVTPLNGLVDALLSESAEIVFLRDATRGGLAGVVADLAERTGLHLTIDEPAIPIRQETLYAAEMLGLDPLSVANEGKVVVVIRAEAAETALQVMRSHRHGRNAAMIGRFEESSDGLCELHTDVGGRRVIQKPYGEELPRIC